MTKDSNLSECSDEEKLFLPVGEVLTDTNSTQWILGDCLGKGAYGAVYIASTEILEEDADNSGYVIKVEESERSGFKREMKFYSKMKKNAMSEWKEEHNLEFLGVPEFISHGIHEYESVSYNFMVMERLGDDLQTLLDQSKNIFPPERVFKLGITILNTLEYIHSNNFIHNDIKALNLLTGLNGDKQDEVYLIDYGFSMKLNKGIHKYDQSMGINGPVGTTIYASRDAHLGNTFSRRSDMEILGYNMIEWMCGKLPWEELYQDYKAVETIKDKYMWNIPLLLNDSFPSKIPPGIEQYFSYVQWIHLDQEPDYEHCRNILRAAAEKCEKHPEKYKLQRTSN